MRRLPWVQERGQRGSNSKGLLQFREEAMVALTSTEETLKRTDYRDINEVKCD